MLLDNFGRRFSYLRLSVTDVCNFRCTYCLPDGYIKPKVAETFLSLSEITHLLSGFSALGFSKLRITGGEPTLRKDIIDIIQSAHSLSQFHTIAITTNGYRLKSLLQPLKQAGLTNLNVSIDSLNADDFAKITGRTLAAPIQEAIENSLTMGFKKVKVNVVMLKGQVEKDWLQFLAWIKDFDIAVRFIELMQTCGRKDYFDRYHLPASYLLDKLQKAGFTQTIRQQQDGPALEYSHPDYLGRIGIIAPYSKDFCHSCNRLRVTSHGALRLCLFGDKNYSLRPYLQSADQQPELISAIKALMNKKQVSHYLQENQMGNNASLSAMGG